MNVVSETNSHIGSGLFLVVYEILDSGKVEAQRETKGVVERVGSRSCDYVRYVERNDREVEASTDGYIAAVAFPLILMRVANATEELAVIRILKTNAILELAQFFFETTGSVSKRLIPSLRRREVLIPVLERLTFERSAIFIYCILRALACRNEVFIYIGIDREAVVVVKRELIRSTQAEVSRDER